ncbi:MAG: prolyl oligopeptidase family serine peptidase [Saprospiraceae bacterium]
MKRIHFFLIILFIVLKGMAQDATTYQVPPKDILDLVTAPPTPAVMFTQKADWMLLLQRNPFLEIADLAQPELKIGGIRINPKAYAQSRVPFIISIKLKNSKSGSEYSISGIPANPKISFVRFSPSEKKASFVHQGEDGNQLWVIDLSSRVATRWSKATINSTLGNPYAWIDDETILAKTVRKSSMPPTINPIPSGPTIQETEGVAAPAATYQDLLKNSDDAKQFEFYCNSDLEKISKNTNQPIATNRIISSLDLSPDNRYLLLSMVKRPFSFLVPYYRFASQVEVLDLNGKSIRVLVDNPIDEVRPKGFDATSKNPRGFQWRDDQPSTVTWIQALDGGDPKKTMSERDALLQLEAPFSGNPATLYKSGLRLRTISWCDQQMAIAEEGMFGTRQTVIKKFNPLIPALKADTLFDFSSDDAYKDPGNLVMTKNDYKRSVVLTDQYKSKIYTISQGASEDGNMPYLASYDFKSKKQDILWRCLAPYYENPIQVVDILAGTFITSRESLTDQPNYFLRNYKGLNPTALTNFPNPQPQLEGVKKEKIQYTRADGIKLTALLYTPKGYDKIKDGPLPVMMWAYPREFKSASDAAQVRGSKYMFTRVSSGSPLFWVLRGYAVMDQTEMPIVGVGNAEPNDTYVQQLVQNAEAAVNKVVELGVGDRNRIGIGGHSYGAFMTANLLAHCDLFKAGIARSGAYNRTLTPFGFQNEERSYWEAPDVYNNMSPFMHADKINEPLLLIHGEADNNSGTFPIQSERLYNAIKGNGGTARLVMLPYESHGYAAKENILHTLYEMDTWLENNVKYPGSKSKKPKS